MTIPVSRISLAVLPYSEDSTSEISSTQVYSWKQAADWLLGTPASLMSLLCTVKMVISWADGYTVTVPRMPLRMDTMQNPGYYVQSYWLHLAGLRKPYSWSEERYKTEILDNPEAQKVMQAAVAALKHYCLSDSNTSPAAQVPVWPEKSEIEHLTLLVAGVVKRCEDDFFESTHGQDQRRSVSTELRKALASLIRAESAV